MENFLHTVFESIGAESALVSHVSDGDPRATYWFPTTLRSNLIVIMFRFLSIPEIMSHTKLCNSAGPEQLQ